VAGSIGSMYAGKACTRRILLEKVITALVESSISSSVAVVGLSSC
jgi:hypothetical protein